jgi:pimeloyl-ACP methyl ester carboxylesterase/DNA-binding CsgD family transcriptional regulator
MGLQEQEGRAAVEQRIGFCTTSDGVRICYAVSGQGLPLVKAPNWLSHLEFERRSPVWRHWWEELARDHTLIRFDQRGSGLSDWQVPEQSFEAWVRDLEAVVEAVGLGRFALLGMSQGGAVAIEYAARHPERVERLVLYGAYTRGWGRRGDRERVEERQALVTLTRAGWGRDSPAYRQVFTARFMPEATLEQMDWFNELQRVSTSPENAAQVQMATREIDVLDRLPSVTAPTLVLHARYDESVPFDQGRLLASLIPNARLALLESRNHLLMASEPAWETALWEVRRFLASEADAAQPKNDVTAPEIVSARRLVTLPAGLTRREAEVLRLVAAGRSNREIGEQLFLSAKTVAQHVTSILNKTGAANRAEAATFAVRNGLA